MTGFETIRRYIDGNEVIEVAQEMVRIPSLTGKEGDGMLNFLDRWFTSLDIPVRTYPRSGGRAHFFADYGMTDNPGRFLINGHQDTKPVNGMTIDPFGGTIENGRMYGRGACDMKGPIAAVLCAYKALVRAGATPSGGVTFYSDIEEELGGEDGFQWALGAGLLEGFEGIISAEPSDLEIHIGNRGGFVTAYEAEGRAVHAGFVRPGDNAIMNMSRFIEDFLKLPYLQVENPYFGRATVNFEKIEGGLFESTVPPRCIACLDSRLIPETPPEKVSRQVDRLITRLERSHGIRIREIDAPREWRPKKGFMKAEFIPPEHELVQRAGHAIREATGKDAVIGGCPAATFAGVMIGRGTPSIIYGPGSIAQAHTADEWVAVDELVEAAAVYAALMANM